VIDHGALTDIILEYMGQVELIGDGIAPSGGGWVSGQPNVVAFRPYMVLVDGGMNPIQTPNLIKTDRPDWSASWSMRYFGGSRRQCEWIAGQFRPSIAGLRGLEFGEDQHRILNVNPLMMGAVMRNDQVDPPYWQAFDNLTMHVTPRNANAAR
jgi:hypothetical protein